MGWMEHGAVLTALAFLPFLLDHRMLSVPLEDLS